jgi:hypothetical protein
MVRGILEVSKGVSLLILKKISYYSGKHTCFEITVYAAWNMLC